MTNLTCFKAYDIRGKLGEELNEDIAYRIGRAYELYSNAKNVVVGGDVRETSEALKLAVAKGLQDGGCNVTDIGMVGTEEIYFATSNLNMDGTHEGLVRVEEETITESTPEGGLLGHTRNSHGRLRPRPPRARAKTMPALARC